MLLPLLGLATLVVGLLIHLQRQGPLTRILGRLKWALPRLERWEPHAQRVDGVLREFYQTRPRTFVVSTGYHLIGWLMGAAEIALLLWFVGGSFRPTEALMIESLLQPLTVAALLIPGALGVKEVGGVWLCQLVGIDHGVGLTLMILKRMPEIVFTGVGLLLLTRAGRMRSR